MFELPIQIIDNFYTSNELNDVWNEINFLKPFLKSHGGPLKSNSAIDEDGNFLRKSQTLVLDQIYSNSNSSPIINYTDKILNNPTIDNLEKINYTFNYIRYCNQRITKLHFYENYGGYDFHIDSAVISAVVWVYQEPKPFTGGDFIFKNGPEIECINNRCVIFPSILSHKVSTVVGSERYSIARFFGIFQELR